MVVAEQAKTTSREQPSVSQAHSRLTFNLTDLVEGGLPSGISFSAVGLPEIVRLLTANLGEKNWDGRQHRDPEIGMWTPFAYQITGYMGTRDGPVIGPFNPFYTVKVEHMMGGGLILEAFMSGYAVSPTAVHEFVTGASAFATQLAQAYQSASSI